MYLLSVHCNQIQYDSTQAKPLLNSPLAYTHSITVFLSSLPLSLFCPSLTLAHAKQKPQDTGYKLMEQGDVVTTLLCGQKQHVQYFTDISLYNSKCLTICQMYGHFTHKNVHICLFVIKISNLKYKHNGFHKKISEHWYTMSMVAELPH